MKNMKKHTLPIEYRREKRFLLQQADLSIHRPRNEIEEELKLRGFELVYEWHDDQVWADKEQQEVIVWISWILAKARVYGFMEEIRF